MYRQGHSTKSKKDTYIQNANIKVKFIPQLHIKNDTLQDNCENNMKTIAESLMIVISSEKLF